MIDLNQAEHFLKLLDPMVEAFTFQTFGEGQARDAGQLTRVLHGSIGELAGELMQLNNGGAGVFVTINETDGTGKRKKENITRVRAIWLDDDNTYKGGCPLPPNIYVETSPNRSHHYWLFEGELSPSQFQALMRTMVVSYGGDANATDLARVMRVPGFYHNKGKPRIVQLINWSEERYSAAELVSILAPPREVITIKEVVTSPENWPKEKERIREALSVISAANRDTWFRYGGAIHDASGGSAEGFELWDSWSQSTTANNYDSHAQHAYWQTHFKNDKKLKASIASIYAEAKKLSSATRDAEIAELPYLPTVNFISSRLDLPTHQGGRVVVPGPLTKGAMDGIKQRFKDYGHNPAPAHWDGLKLIAKVVERMAAGLELTNFYVSFLPAGMGKTTTLVESIKALVSLDQFSQVGVIIFLSRLEEVRTLISAMGLSDDQFAVIASEGKEENKLGRQDDKTLARVLFTTHKGLEARSANGTKFADMNRLFFRGKPRQVRVWDEAILPSKNVTLGRFEIERLLHGFSKAGHGDIAKALDDWCGSLKNSSEGNLIQVPELENDGDEFRAVFEKDSERLTVKCLIDLSGRVLRVHSDNTGNTAIGYEDVLPADIAPLLILDASGQQRKTYELWYKDRKRLFFLSSPQKTYEGLTVHHWNKGFGKIAHLQGQGLILADGVARTVNGISQDDEVLVIHFKQTGNMPNMPQEITKRLVGNVDRVKFCNWGRETATNDYCKSRHVILAGVPQYPSSQYEATARGAKGSRTDDDTNLKDVHDTRLGEVAHRILQAANRGMVRKCVDGGCPPDCHLYVAFSTHASKGIPDAILRRIFPRAKFEPWIPISNAKGRVRELVDLIDQLNDGEAIAIADIGKRLEITDPRNVRKLLKHPDFKATIGQRGTVLIFLKSKVQVGKRHPKADPFVSEPSGPPENRYEVAEAEETR